MAIRQYANAPATTLTASCSNVALSMTVASVAGLPISYPYTIILDRGTATEEAVDVTAAGGLVLTITRGVDGTTAFAHANGATAEHGITARDVKEPNVHINASTGVHGVTGAVVGTTDTQTLTNKTATTPATADNDTKVATTAFVKAALLATHPVGSIFIHTSNTNPSTFIGGTWIAWGSGRVPVGVDAGQTEFDTAEETGGAKTHALSTAEMPAHTHAIDHDHGSTNTGSQSIFTWNPGSSEIPDNYNLYSSQPGFTAIQTWSHTFGDAHTHTVDLPNFTGSSGSAGSTNAHNNLQPYITCYMFKRTA